MKTLRNLLTAVAIMMGTLTMNAQSMSITAIRSNARFLTDRMAYTLGISDPFLIDEIYRINYDYIYGVNTYLDDIALGYYYDDYMLVCDARDIALRNLLGITVWNRLIGYSYFHRPIIFSNHRWHFGVYDYDRFGATYFHYAAPRPFGNGYAGGHFFGGMAPRGGRGNATPPPPPGGGMNNGRGNAGAPSAPQGGMNNGRGNAGAPSAPQGGMNNGRGNASTPSAPQGGMNNGKGNGNHSGNATAPSNSGHSSRGSYTGSRSQSNMQSSSRASSTRTSTGRSNSGSVSRGGGSGASRGGSGGGARGGGRR